MVSFHCLALFSTIHHFIACSKKLADLRKQGNTGLSGDKTITSGNMSHHKQRNFSGPSVVCDHNYSYTDYQVSGILIYICMGSC